MSVQMELSKIIISEMQDSQIIQLKEVDGERRFARHHRALGTHTSHLDRHGHAARRGQVQGDGLARRRRLRPAVPAHRLERHRPTIGRKRAPRGAPYFRRTCHQRLRRHWLVGPQAI